MFQTILLCWMCRKPYRLTIDLFQGADMGSPRYWCRDCTRPRLFSKRLRERMVEEETQAALGVDAWNALTKMIATEHAIEEDRAEALAA